MSFKDGVLYLKSGGNLVGALDIKAAAVANGFNFGPGGVDEVIAAVSDESNGLTSTGTARVFVGGDAAGIVMLGAEGSDVGAVEIDPDPALASSAVRSA